MRSLLTDLVHVALSLPVYLVAVLAALAIAAFRRSGAARLRRWRHAFAAGALAAYCTSTQVSADMLLAALEDRFRIPAPAQQPRDPASTILVLAAGYPRLTAQGYRSSLTADGLERVLVGVQLWRRSGGKLVFSGAPTPDFADSMAHEMARTAVQLGVPREAILVEGRSANTYENLLFSRELLREAGRLDGPLVLVVSALQMPRAAAVAQKLGLRALAFPSGFRARPRPRWQDWIPSNDAAADFESVMHELIGLLAYRLRGWI